MLQQTNMIHLGDLSTLPMLQLSYSHIIPIGWKHIKVPSSAPMRETRLSKTGMALAIMYEIRVAPNVHPNQVAQWITVLAVRCSEPRSKRTKTYFPGS